MQYTTSSLFLIFHTTSKMRPFVGLILFTSAMVEAAPANSPRQAVLAQIVTVDPQGPGCPRGSFTPSFSPDRSTVTLAFTKYNARVSPSDLSAHRELFCDVFLTVNYPLGCTAAVLDATYRGVAQVQKGVTGTATAQYNLSPGKTGKNPPATTFTSANFGGAGHAYSLEDKITLSENISNNNQRNVSLIARTRIFLVTSGSTQSGTLTNTNTTLAIVQQSRC